MSSGRVEVRFGPVADHDDFLDVADAIRRIRSVREIEVGPVHAGDGTLWVALSRPTTLGAELRRVLGRRVQHCTRVDDVFVVGLAARALGGPRHLRADGDRWLSTPSAMDRGDGRVTTAGGLRFRRAQEEHAELVTDAMRAVTDVSTIVFDTDLRCRAAVGPIHEQDDYLPGAMVGRRLADAIASPAWSRMEDACVAALHGTRTTLTFLGEVRPDREYEVTIVPVLRAGTITGGVVRTREIVIDRAGGGIARDLQQAFDLIFQFSPIAQALLAPDGRWAHVNPALCARLRRPVEQLIGQDLWALMETDAAAEVRATLDVLRAGDRESVTVEISAQPGELVPVTVVAARAADGTLHGFVIQVLSQPPS